MNKNPNSIACVFNGVRDDGSEDSDENDDKDVDGGAVELAARAGQLHVDPNAFHNFGTGGTPIVLADATKAASQADSWGVGLNWYLNTDIKLMIDYDQTHFDGGAPHGNRPAEHALLSRIQVSW
ncbi:MAG TPA: porin [Verrucomicrobiae bacterium]|nr:porin [Verrucomicrobiae bacterium]